MKKRRSGYDSPLLGILFTAPTILLMMILLFGPMGYQAVMSLFDYNLAGSGQEFLGLSGYIELLKDASTLQIFKNSAVWTMCVTGLQFLVGLWAAVTVNRKFFAQSIFKALIIVPWIIPGTVAAMIWRLFYNAQLGFLNTVLQRIGILERYVDWLGEPQLAMGAAILVAVWKGFGFSALMYMAGLQSIPQELYEAADVDGANVVQKFFYITMPCMSNIIKTTLLLTGIWTFNYFEIIYVLTGGGPLNKTHIPVTYIYEMAFKNADMGDSSRLAVISMILVGIVAVIYLKKTNKEEWER